MQENVGKENVCFAALKTLNLEASATNQEQIHWTFIKWFVALLILIDSWILHVMGIPFYFCAVPSVVEEAG